MYPQVDYIPGGATQNTIRIAQTLLQSKLPNSCAFIGCVGKDSYAEQMTKACAEAGFTPLYLEVRACERSWSLGFRELCWLRRCCPNSVMI